MFNETFTFSAFTVQYLNLSRFAAVTFTPYGKKSGRRHTVTVQNPSMLITRRDGNVTIKAANKANTRQVYLRGGVLTLIDHDGKSQSYDLV